MTAPRRIVIGEDDVLLREGVERVLAVAGFEVAARAGDADDLLRKGLAHRPDLLVADINMRPATGTTGSWRPSRCRDWSSPSTTRSAAQNSSWPTVLTASGICSRSASGGSRSSRTPRLAPRRAGAPSTPGVVARILGRRRKMSGIAKLSPRELEVTAAMAGGKSNRGIAGALVISVPAIEKHINRIFGKLGIDAGDSEHRRLHAVLTGLRES